MQPDDDTDEGDSFSLLAISSVEWKVGGVEAGDGVGLGVGLGVGVGEEVDDNADGDGNRVDGESAATDVRRGRATPRTNGAILSVTLRPGNGSRCCR